MPIRTKSTSGRRSEAQADLQELRALVDGFVKENDRQVVYETRSTSFALLGPHARRTVVRDERCLP